MKRLLLLVVMMTVLLGGAYFAFDYHEAVADLSWAANQESASTIWTSGMFEGDEFEVVAEISGRVVDVLAEEGDEVQADHVLIRLGTNTLDDQIVSAWAAVQESEANLEAVLDPVKDEEIAIARARVAQARAAQTGAERALLNATTMRDNPLELDTRVNEAQSQVEITERQIEAAEAQLAQAEAGRDRYEFSASDEDKTKYQVYLKQVEAAQSAIADATAAYEGMQQQLAGLREIRDNPIELNVNVNAAQAEVELANQAVAVADADLALLEAGPREEDVAIAQAKVDIAQTKLEELEIRRNKMTLRSPTSGQVSTRVIEPGEVAAAGRTLMTMSNLDRVTLTVYVPEDEIGKVTPGQRVDVYVDSFPGESFSGVVSNVASEAEFTPKNVQTRKERVNLSFATKIEIPNPNHVLKPGMPADAVIHLDDIIEPDVLIPSSPSATNTPLVPVTAIPSATPVSTSWTPQVVGSDEEEVATERVIAPTPEAVATARPAATSTAPTAASAAPTQSPEPDVVLQPSGKLIFATQDENGVYSLWEINTDGSGRRLVATDTHQPDAREGDGMLVAKGAGGSEPETLLALHLDGSDVQEASMYTNDVNPRWSPDGTRLMYVNEQVGEIVLQDSSERDARRVPLYYDIVPLLGHRPAWLDEEHVVYQGCDVWRGGSLCGLYVAEISGGAAPWRIVDDIHATAPAVKDGRIAYMSNAGGNWDVFLLEPGRSGPLQLTDASAAEGLPTWSPDGEWLAFLSNRGGEWAMWAVRPESDEEPIELFRLGASPGDDWTGEQIAWVD